MCNDTDFVGRFCMPRYAFVNLQTARFEKGIFRLKIDTLEPATISLFICVIAALRIPAYEKSFNKVDEL